MRRVFAAVLLLSVVSCSSSRSTPTEDAGTDVSVDFPLPNPRTPGMEGGPCYGNGTCDAGLTCASNLCVRSPDAAPRDAVVLDFSERDQYVWPDTMPPKDQYVWPDTTPQDQYVWPDAIVVPDAPAELTCGEILDCLDHCGTDQTCAQNCLGRASAAAVSQFGAVQQCIVSAISGTCAADCGNQSSPECNACLTTTCAAQLNTCLGGTGIPIDGFGDVCDVAAPACKTGLACVGPITGGAPDKGFCSAQCNAPGLPCPDAPVGTSAMCALQTGSFHMCAFICQLGTVSYPCPTGLTCAPADPSGIRTCLP